jgi:extracellular matrix protein 14
MRLLQALFPSFTNITSIGKSAEGRDIWAFRIGERSADEKGPRKTILVTGGLHGREWISTSTTSYLLWSMVTSFGTDPMITKLLQRFDIVFIPILNPDGYEYTWQEDRLWRKSRQQTKMRYCRGLDLDHAFGYEWESTQHQTDPCSESYGGDQPFQAIEASGLADWAKNETKNGVNFIGFLDLHSYSQQVLFPYSYTCSVDPPNRENLEELAVGLTKAIRLSSGEFYTVASACEGAVARVFSASDSYPRLESGGGSAIDWFYRRILLLPFAVYSYANISRRRAEGAVQLPGEAEGYWELRVPPSEGEHRPNGRGNVERAQIFRRLPSWK